MILLWNVLLFLQLVFGIHGNEETIEKCKKYGNALIMDKLLHTDDMEGIVTVWDVNDFIDMCYGGGKLSLFLAPGTELYLNYVDESAFIVRVHKHSTWVEAVEYIIEYRLNHASSSRKDRHNDLTLNFTVTNVLRNTENELALKLKMIGAIESTNLAASWIPDAKCPQTSASPPDDKIALLTTRVITREIRTNLETIYAGTTGTIIYTFRGHMKDVQTNIKSLNEDVLRIHNFTTSMNLEKGLSMILVKVEGLKPGTAVIEIDANGSLLYQQKQPVHPWIENFWNNSINSQLDLNSGDELKLVKVFIYDMNSTEMTRGYEPDANGVFQITTTVPKFSERDSAQRLIFVWKGNKEPFYMGTVSEKRGDIITPETTQMGNHVASMPFRLPKTNLSNDLIEVVGLKNNGSEIQTKVYKLNITIVRPLNWEEECLKRVDPSIDLYSGPLDVVALITWPSNANDTKEMEVHKPNSDGGYDISMKSDGYFSLAFVLKGSGPNIVQHVRDHENGQLDTFRFNGYSKVEPSPPNVDRRVLIRTVPYVVDLETQKILTVNLENGQEKKTFDICLTRLGSLSYLHVE